MKIYDKIKFGLEYRKFRFVQFLIQEKCVMFKVMCRKNVKQMC